MGITERRQLEIENLKKKIIAAANEILIEEGYEKLSIRKIASRIEYSPGNIYHYFKDKSEIISYIVASGYKNILKEVSKIKIDYENPAKTITDGLRAYINYMLRNPEQFKVILMNSIDEVQAQVNILEKGISKQRESIANLTKFIELGIESGNFREMDAELTAQNIWADTYGLIGRLIIEESISEIQKSRLIDNHLEMITFMLQRRM